MVIVINDYIFLLKVIFLQSICLLPMMILSCTVLVK